MTSFTGSRAPAGNPPTGVRLARLTVRDALVRRRDPVPREVLDGAREIVDGVRAGGAAALRGYAERFGDRAPGEPLVLGRAELERAWRATAPETRGVLERTAARIRRFAEAQRACLVDLAYGADGLAMGHRVSPVDRAGCYAPGGRYPLPSSVLMTAVTARAAGVGTVWVASPRPAPATLAAAWIAGADAVLAAGGAHAIAALAYGIDPAPRCDVIAGPGNVWVTAAKALVNGAARIDALAGPSELLIVIDDSADPDLVAADLLAQAEHDPEAIPGIIALDGAPISAVESAVDRRLAALDTAETARTSLERNGFVLAARSPEEAAELADAIAPEHLQILVRDPERLAARVRHYGGLFIGAGAGEVLGDYGAGPNHVLPTGGSARANGGLSVLTFLKVTTWMRADGGVAEPGYAETVGDAARLAALEGLSGHAAAALARRAP